jgi:hypothetical protein
MKDLLHNQPTTKWSLDPKEDLQPLMPWFSKRDIHELNEDIDVGWGTDQLN